MCRIPVFLFCLFFAALALPSMAAAQECTLTVNVDGIRNDTGMVRAMVFGSDENFPFGTSKVFKILQGVIKDGKATLEVKGVPYGTYAISVYHDENNSGYLEQGAYGKPKEGIGASNNPPKKNRPPTFEEARFTISEEAKVINITMVYY